MPSAFRSRHDLVARVYDTGLSDYLGRMTAHYESADTMRAQRTTRVPGEMSTHTAWEASDLRAWGHEMELARECEQAMYECARGRYRALNRAYQHACFCRVRDESATTPAPRIDLVRSSRMVASEHAGETRNTSAPPGQLRTLSVLATCHASNAPGLSAHAQRMETGTT